MACSKERATVRRLFPEFTSAAATADLSSLKNFGFPDDLIASWAAEIPSLNQLQIDAINDSGVLRGEHLIASAPTSSGKTMLGELAAIKGVVERKRAIFLLPMKALVSDKVRQFKRVYGSYGIRTVEASTTSGPSQVWARNLWIQELITVYEWRGPIYSRSFKFSDG
ncbi:DEAD/DEAH box helicase [Terriglobus sp. ADX1]|uniref:DEAD/DEAH box helicase n=1 Tax=Terriglobus sp. ADX1 TaxID=2794063 RepID=UPI002FE5C252